MHDTARVRALNDEFRKTMKGGKVVVTRGVADLPDIAGIIERVRLFSDFNNGNDPHGEHDFGAFTYNDEQLFWKIDCYDADLKCGSPDPTDIAATTRVLTIMTGEDM